MQPRRRSKRECCNRFASSSHDLLNGVVGYTQSDSQDSRDLLAWVLTVNESGRALIDLRQVLVRSDLPPPVQEIVQQAVQALVRLYEEPSASLWQQADQLVTEAINAAGNILANSGTSDQGVMLHLYQLRSALRDDELALAPYQAVIGTTD